MYTPSWGRFWPHFPISLFIFWFSSTILDTWRILKNLELFFQEIQNTKLLILLINIYIHIYSYIYSWILEGNPMHVYVNYIINLFMDICTVPFKISRNRPKELFPQWFQPFRGLKPLSRFFKIFQDFQEMGENGENGAKIGPRKVCTLICVH